MMSTRIVTTTYASRAATSTTAPPTPTAPDRASRLALPITVR